MAVSLEGYFKICRSIGQCCCRTRQLCRNLAHVQTGRHSHTDILDVPYLHLASVSHESQNPIHTATIQGQLKLANISQQTATWPDCHNNHGDHSLGGTEFRSPSPGISSPAFAISDIIYTHQFHSLLHTSSSQVTTWDKYFNVSLSLSFGVTVDTEAGMTVHSQCWGLIQVWPSAR